MLKHALKRDDLLFIVVLALALCLVGFVISGNIYNSLYPPLFTGPKINVEEVLKRIDEAKLTPTEARYYRVIEKDRQGNVVEINESGGISEDVK